jgi:hypothetical protein
MRHAYIPFTFCLKIIHNKFAMLLKHDDKVKGIYTLKNLNQVLFTIEIQNS